ncbi:MAG: hypothetical protein AB7J40_02200 [Candidatus Altimarinota bacterium]
MANNTNPDRMREARGLEALNAGKESPGVDEGEMIEASSSGMLGKLGDTFKKLAGKEPNDPSATVQNAQQNRQYAGYAAKANLLEQVQKTAGQMMTSGLPNEEGEGEEDLMLQQQGEAAIASATQQQQQAAVKKQQEQLQQQQQLLEEKRRQQREMDRRKRRKATVPKASVVKKAAEEGLQPLDAGLLPTPFGPVWACYRIYKWFQ